LTYVKPSGNRYKLFPGLAPYQKCEVPFTGA
jgi:hypothetical protein